MSIFNYRNRESADYATAFAELYGRALMFDELDGAVRSINNSGLSEKEISTSVDEERMRTLARDFRIKMKDYETRVPDSVRKFIEESMEWGLIARTGRRIDQFLS